MKNGQEKLVPSEDEFNKVISLYSSYFEDVLGLGGSTADDQSAQKLDDVMQVLLNIRASAKSNKDYGTADAIRNQLKAIGVTVMDGKDGADWQFDA